MTATYSIFYALIQSEINIEKGFANHLGFWYVSPIRVRRILEKSFDRDSGIRRTICLKKGLFLKTLLKLIQSNNHKN